MIGNGSLVVLDIWDVVIKGNERGRRRAGDGREWGRADLVKACAGGLGWVMGRNGMGIRIRRMRRRTSQLLDYAAEIILADVVDLGLRLLLLVLVLVLILIQI